MVDVQMRMQDQPDVIRDQVDVPSCMSGRLSLGRARGRLDSLSMRLSSLISSAMQSSSPSAARDSILLFGRSGQRSTAVVSEASTRFPLLLGMWAFYSGRDHVRRAAERPDHADANSIFLGGGARERRMYLLLGRSAMSRSARPDGGLALEARKAEQSEPAPIRGAYCRMERTVDLEALTVKYGTGKEARLLGQLPQRLHGGT
jgi:hypothetical protein